MSLAERIRKLRNDKDLSLDDLADAANISKTYLWELEKDSEGAKKPSADVLMRIAAALSTTLADILALETVTVREAPVEIPPALKEFQKRMEAQQTPLTPEDLQDLAAMKFRGGQPQTADEWHQLYFLLANSTRKKKS
ncbi:helix-turn-helix transcriptional regulator [Planctomycetales bacterium ZRK34]|nr:helix-turn-helix transcriptional regulator [Planctomycetales bacterium ZRK34]